MAGASGNCRTVFTAFTAFALFDMDDHPLAVDIGDFEGLGVEEPVKGPAPDGLDATEGDGHGCPFPLLRACPEQSRRILDVQSVVAQFLFGDLIRWLVVVLRELGYGARVALLGAFRESFELHVFKSGRRRIYVGGS